MDVVIGYLACEKWSIKGSPFSEKSARNCLSSIIKTEINSCFKKQDFQNEEELLFTAFNQLAFSTLNGLSKRNRQIEEENQRLRDENEMKKQQCKQLKKELTDVKNKQEDLRSCKTCTLYKGERQHNEQKYTNLEKQLKKCAFIINSSLDGGTKVLGRVREILSQGVDNSNLDSQECDENLEMSQQPAVKANFCAAAKPILSFDEDNTTILAPSSPDRNDMETQAFGGPGEDHVICVPETVPFDLPKSRGIVFQNRNYVPGPINGKFPTVELAKKSVTPIKCGSPKKRNFNLGSPSLLEVSTYSPPLSLDFALPSVLLQPIRPNTKEVDPPAKKTISQMKMQANMYENVHLQGPISKRPLAEQQTPTSKKNKSLKQTKLTLSGVNKDVSVAPIAANVNLVTRMPTKTVRISPPGNLENKRRRRGKGPEDWTCKECYKLFREAEAEKKIDVRKMPVSMNFCPEHFNRYTYYLSTPPNFWDCGIGKPPRNGHLHPLDASMIKDDDDDDFVE